MPRYRVLEKSFIDNKLVEEGEIVEYEGETGSNLELIEDSKPAGKKGGKAADDLV